MQPRQKTLVWLIATQSFYVLSLIPWVAIAAMAVMAFDAPGSTEHWGPWLFAGTIWSYPLWLVVCAVAAWVFYAWHRLRAAVIATSLPLLGGLALALVLLVWTQLPS